METNENVNGYESQSTIDNPPPEVNSEDSDNSSSKKSESDLYVGERMFEVDLTVTLKPVGGKAAKWPLLVEECRGTTVRERLEYALKAAENIEVVEAMLRNPRQYLRGENSNPAQEELL